MGLDQSTLTIERSNERLAVPRDAIEALDLSTRRSQRGKHAAIGLLAGLAAAIIVAATYEEEPFLGGDPLFSKGDIFVGSMILLVPAGALAGAALVPGERWTAATLSPAPPPADVPVTAAERGVGLKLPLEVRGAASTSTPGKLSPLRGSVIDAPVTSRACST